MKYLYLLLSLLLLAGLLTQCKKAATVACPIGDQTPQFVEFELQDKQQRDMFNPNTPGHFDTLAIRYFNTNIWLVPARYNTDHPGRTALLVPFLQDGYQYIKLSATVVDTVYTKYNIVQTSPCNFDLVRVKLSYNSQSFTDSLNKGYFVVTR